MLATLLFWTAAASGPLVISDFQEYVRVFNKSYNAQEYKLRRVLFEQRLQELIEHNSNPANTWYKSINALSDSTIEELQSLLGGRSNLLRPLFKQVPENVDIAGMADSLNWCDKGACTPVKNQGACGSCWAFAGTETIESAYYLNTQKTIILGPQQFVDCTPNPKKCGGTGGCQGSTADLLFEYATKHGAATEADYPYTGRDGTCKNRTAAVKVAGFTQVASNDEKAVLAAVNISPLAVNVDASRWSAYGGGVISFSSADLDINHVVQLVGYGTDNGLDYWYVRNSWGPNWGLRGFIKLRRYTSDPNPPCGTDRNNQDGVGCEDDPKQVTVCGTNGIAYAVSYPTGVTST